MKFIRKWLLARELAGEGAGRAEANELAEIALDFKKFKADDHLWRSFLGWWSTGLILGVVASVLLTALSLNSLPGEPLHGVKVAAEHGATTVNPSLHASVMMDRSREVEELARQHRPAKMIQATLVDYNQEMGHVKGQPYPAMEYCSKQLKAASQDTQGDVHDAIENTLQNLPGDQT